MVGDVQSARPIASGALLIKTFTKQQAQEIIKKEEFLGEPVKTSARGEDTVEAMVYVPSLTGVPDEELLAELRPQGVVGVTRLRGTKQKRNQLACRPAHR